MDLRRFVDVDWSDFCFTRGESIEHTIRAYNILQSHGAKLPHPPTDATNEKNEVSCSAFAVATQLALNLFAVDPFAARDPTESSPFCFLLLLEKRRGVLRLLGILVMGLID